MMIGLKRALIWCKSTIDDARIIRVTSLTDIFARVDTGYIVHTDMRSHTGDIMSMDMVEIYS